MSVVASDTNRQECMNSVSRLFSSVPFLRSYNQLEEGELPLLHRLTIVYLLIPIVIWLLGWFRLEFGIPCALLLIAAFWKPLSGRWLPWKTEFHTSPIVVLFAACALVTITPAFGLFGAGNTDWVDNRVYLKFLVTQDWPTFLPDLLSPYITGYDSPPIYRYYIASFLPPTLLGKLIGLSFLNFAIYLWIAIGLSLGLLLFTKDRKGLAVVVAIIIFLLFSGLDVIYAFFFADSFEDYLGHWDLLRINLGKIHIIPHITYMLIQFQHFIPVLLYVMLMFHLHSHRRFVGILGLLLVISFLWSPWVIIGTLPLILVILWKHRLLPFLSWQNIIVSVPILGIIGIYLTSGSSNFVHGWTFSLIGWKDFMIWLPQFYLLEYGIILLLVVVIRTDLLRSPFFIASSIALILFPLYSGPAAIDNKALPSFIILCWFVVDTLINSFSNIILSIKQRFALSCLIFVLILSSFMPITATFLSLSQAAIFRFDEVDFNRSAIFFTWKENAGYEIHPILHALLKDVEQTNSLYDDDKGKLIIQSNLTEYNVYFYVDDGTLLFVNKECLDSDKMPFYVVLYPLDIDSSLYGEELNILYHNDYHLFFDRMCIVPTQLPVDMDGRIEVGQYNPDTSDEDGIDKIWTEEYVFPTSD